MDVDLQVKLHRRREDSLVADAEFIRDQPEGTERTEVANQIIREVMLKYEMRHISAQTKSHVLNVLSFAMPDA